MKGWIIPVAFSSIIACHEADEPPQATVTATQADTSIVIGEQVKSNKDTLYDFQIPAYTNQSYYVTQAFDDIKFGMVEKYGILPVKYKYTIAKQTMELGRTSFDSSLGLYQFYLTTKTYERDNKLIAEIIKDLSSPIVSKYGRPEKIEELIEAYPKPIQSLLKIYHLPSDLYPLVQDENQGEWLLVWITPEKIIKIGYRTKNDLPDINSGTSAQSIRENLRKYYEVFIQFSSCRIKAHRDSISTNDRIIQFNEDTEKF
jgi:hypothetical protein